eukprot:121444-Pyramimonas_sp.AAC.1
MCAPWPLLAQGGPAKQNRRRASDAPNGGPTGRLALTTRMYMCDAVAVGGGEGEPAGDPLQVPLPVQPAGPLAHHGGPRQGDSGHHAACGGAAPAVAARVRARLRRPAQRAGVTHSSHMLY